MILIGSRALAIRKPEILLRKPLDFDFISSSQEECFSWIENNSKQIVPQKQYFANPYKYIVEGKVNCEFEIAGVNSNTQQLIQAIQNDPNTIATDQFGLIPSLDFLFLIKSSHKFLKNSPHFWKTLVDYHLMKRSGAKIPDQELLKLREKETYTYLHPNLNQSKKAFFSDDLIQYTYDHDSIHEAVKSLERPAYSYFQKDDAEVATSKEKFLQCSREIQLLSVIEESAVLAIERSLVPHPNVLSPYDAWKFALSKVCSSIASGWWRDFAYENALEIVKLYPKDYWEKFQNGLANGIVKPFQP